MRVILISFAIELQLVIASLERRCQTSMHDFCAKFDLTEVQGAREETLLPDVSQQGREVVVCARQILLW